jgi:hypothetical protein
MQITNLVSPLEAGGCRGALGKERSPAALFPGGKQPCKQPCETNNSRRMRMRNLMCTLHKVHKYEYI